MIYFGVECDEFLRAPEILVIFRRQNVPAECDAKLYRNHHVRLNAGHVAIRPLSSPNGSIRLDPAIKNPFE